MNQKTLKSYEIHYSMAVVSLMYIVFLVFGAFYFELCRTEIKENIYKHFFSKDLKIFEFNQPIASNEIVIEGILYDIIEHQEMNGKYRIKCFADFEEMELNENIKENYLGKNAGSNQKSKRNIIALLKQIYLPNFPCVFLFYGHSKQINNQKTIAHYYIFKLKTKSPPPDFPS